MTGGDDVVVCLDNSDNEDREDDSDNDNDDKVTVSSSQPTLPTDLYLVNR